MKTLILQSHAANPPAWIKQCTASVRAFAQRNGYEYLWLGDELFGDVSRKCDRFSTVTRTDIGRLQWIRDLLSSGCYDAVYWLDADILIWDLENILLPPCMSGAVVCAREGFFMKRPHFSITDLRVNNSVLGFCDANDVEVLIERSNVILSENIGRERQVLPTLIGTDLFSSPNFPLRQIQIKSVGCFSADSVKELLRFHTGFAHLWMLGMAHGATMRAANLCSSAKRSESEMDDLVYLMEAHRGHDIGRWHYVAPLWRLALRGIRWVDHVRWIMMGRPALDPIHTSANP